MGGQFDVYDQYGNRIGTANRGSGGSGTQCQGTLIGCSFFMGIGQIWALIASLIASILAIITAIRYGFIVSMIVAQASLLAMYASFYVLIVGMGQNNPNLFFYGFLILFFGSAAAIFFLRKKPYWIIYYWYYVRCWPPGTPAWITIGLFQNFTTADLRRLRVEEAVGIYAK